MLVRDGATILTGHTMNQLVVEDDRVVGVRCATDEDVVELRAARGVLIAAGGFEGNAALRAEHGVPGDVGWSMAPRGTNTG